MKASLISTINGKADASALNGKQDKLTAGTYIDIDASNNIDVKASLISTINGKADASALNGKQDVLTAGSGISIVNNVISATGGGGGGGIDLDNPDYSLHYQNVTFLIGWSMLLSALRSDLPIGNYYMYMYLEATSGVLDKIEQIVVFNNTSDQSLPFSRVYFNKAVNTSNIATKNSFQGYVRKIESNFDIYTQAIDSGSINHLYMYFWEV